MTKTKKQISYNMKRVKFKDSEIELLLRKELWNRGLALMMQGIILIFHKTDNFKKAFKRVWTIN